MEQTLAAIRRLQKNEQPLNFVRSRPLRRFRLHGCIKRRGPEKKLNGCEEANRQLLNPPRFARSEDNIIAPSDFEQKPRRKEIADSIQELESLRKAYCIRIRMQAFRGRKLV